jgi:hypothetical protein
MEKGDDVADDDDGDALRTNVSQDQVTVTLCTEEFFLMTRFIQLFPHIRQVIMLGGRIWMVNTTHLVVPTGFYTSQLVFHGIYRVSSSAVFIQLFCDWGRQIKPIFLFSDIH